VNLKENKTKNLQQKQRNNFQQPIQTNQNHPRQALSYTLHLWELLFGVIIRIMLFWHSAIVALMMLFGR